MKHFLPQCQGKKLNSLRILNRASQYCRWREILNEKANLKVDACSKRVFQNSDKKTQDNGSIMWLVWNELFKWIYLETNESEFFLCFLKIKTWRHILGNTYYLGTEVLFCFVLFILWMKSNILHKYAYFLWLESFKIISDNQYKYRGVADFLWKNSSYLKSGISLLFYL